MDCWVRQSGLDSQPSRTYAHHYMAQHKKCSWIGETLSRSLSLSFLLCHLYIVSIKLSFVSLFYLYELDINLSMEPLVDSYMSSNRPH
jgi:hypothetical protein